MLGRDEYGGLQDGPLVSMIVLCYNQANFVVDTLEGVKAQTYRPTELIILDDCSSDDSVAVIEGWLNENGMDCTFIRHEKNQGVCKSLNDALSRATGKYVSMTAADDVWIADKIERQVEIMERQPESVGVLYGDALQIDEHGCPLPEMFIASHRKLREMPQGAILSTLLEGNFIPGMTTLVRRGCYEEVGYYDENLPWEDWDMWMRIARRYAFIYCNTLSAKYRVHARSYSRSDPARMLRDGFKVILKHASLDGLSQHERSAAVRTLSAIALGLYRQRDRRASDALLELSRLSGEKRHRWMYRFARLGLPCGAWEQAIAWRARLKMSAAQLKQQDT